VNAEQCEVSLGAYCMQMSCKNISLSSQGGGLALFSFDKKEEDVKYLPKLILYRENPDMSWNKV